MEIRTAKVFVYVVRAETTPCAQQSIALPTAERRETGHKEIAPSDVHVFSMLASQFGSPEQKCFYISI